MTLGKEYICQTKKAKLEIGDDSFWNQKMLFHLKASLISPKLGQFLKKAIEKAHLERNHQAVWRIGALECSDAIDEINKFLN